MSLVQDPVSFLSAIREDCPDILSILTTEQVRLLSRCPTDPYSPGEVDREYLTDAWNHQNIRMVWRESKLKLTEVVLEPRKSLTYQDLEIYERKKKAVEKVWWI